MTTIYNMNVVLHSKFTKTNPAIFSTGGWGGVVGNALVLDYLHSMLIKRRFFVILLSNLILKRVQEFS